MTSKEKEEYIKNKLPYEILKKIYFNSRISLRKFGRELGISYHVVKSVLKKLEEEYEIKYTLELDEAALGFVPGKIVLVKFGDKPSIDIIKGALVNDPYVQDAYLAEGDFDLLLYVVGLTQQEFGAWQWRFRLKFSRQDAVLYVADNSRTNVGFFPLRNEVIEKSPVLSKSEKQILMLLNSNSRIKLVEIAKKLKVKDLDRVLYIIKKLKKMGIIKRFSALTQNPDKKLFYAYTAYVNPTEEHTKLRIEFSKNILSNLDSEIVNEYNVILDAQGSFDSLFICAFSDGEALAKRGSDLLKNLWSKENPIIKKAILTGIIVGEWPFHLEEIKV
jgi:DNA-binding Lrp family transcriptional regulator